MSLQLEQPVVAYEFHCIKIVPVSVGESIRLSLYECYAVGTLPSVIPWAGQESGSILA